MNKRTIFVSLLAITFLAPSCFAQMKVGTINLEKVLNEYYKTKDAQAKLQDVEKSAQKELDDRVATFKGLAEELKKLDAEANKPELSKDKLDEARKQFQTKANELRTKEQEINDFKKLRQNQLQEQMIRMRKGIIDEIVKVVNDKVKGEGYDLVLDRSALSVTGTPVTIFAKDDMDFSGAIITTLNKNAPKAASSSAAQ
ncbi:MAG: OmpH family outer membrane protein [Chthoniobacterales bacterium]